VATNQFDAGGGFRFTEALEPSAPQRLFLLQVP